MSSRCGRARFCGRSSFARSGRSPALLQDFLPNGFLAKPGLPPFFPPRGGLLLDEGFDALRVDRFSSLVLSSCDDHLLFARDLLSDGFLDHFLVLAASSDFRAGLRPPSGRWFSERLPSDRSPLRPDALRLPGRWRPRPLLLAGLA